MAKAGLQHLYDDRCFSTNSLRRRDHHLFGFSFDSADYEADLRKSCKTYDFETEDDWNCGAEFAALQRDFSTLIDQQGTLARKPRREEFVQELFTLFDHIVISETAGN